MNNKILAGLCLAAGLPALASAASPQPPSPAEMWEIIQKQQREIESLKSGQRASDEKADAAMDAAEQASRSGGTGSGWAQNTQIGGYGELHYNNLDSKKEIDFHRFVLFVGHQFSDRLRFFSELELEHALSGDGEEGEVELEQAYIEYDLNESNRAKAGLFLLPVGILNETHEPTTFYGVERNPVETNIVPTTWWAGGLGLSGELAPGVSYDLALHEGLNTASYSIRGGRQKTSEADASDLAATGRLKWTGMPGVELAATLQYQDNITQGVDNDANAWLFETHADIHRGPFGLRALYALWDIDGDAAKAAGRNEQEGFYIEPSWKLLPKFGVFARFSQWDNEADSGSDSEMRQWNAGFNFWPHPDVVLKADLQSQNNEGSLKNDNGFNLGIGYQF